VIWRLPRGENLSHPGSHCPQCGVGILWYDNVPVVSWILLRRRCRACGMVIPWRYPAVELLSAALWLAAGLIFGMTAQAAMAVFFFYLLLILSFIDLDLRRLPNSLVVLLILVGCAGVLVSQLSAIEALPLLGGNAHGIWGQPVISALLGAVAAAGFILLIAVGYQRIRNKPGLGMGDVKLLVAIGLYLGLYALLALFVATVLGSVYSIVSARGRRADLREVAIPFGPFLAVASVMVTAFGPQVWSWYLGLVT